MSVFPNGNCPSHPSMRITNLCLICSEPICPECLGTHDQNHKGSNVLNYLSLPKAQNLSKQKIDSLLVQFREEKVKLARLSEYGKQVLKDKNLNLISQAKKNVEITIEAFFRKMEIQILKEIDNFHVSDPAEVEKTVMKVNDSILQLEKISHKLENENSLKTVLKIFDDKSLSENYIQVSNDVNKKLQIFQMNLSHIEISDEKLKPLNDVLSQYCRITKGPMKEENLIQILGKNENKTIKEVPNNISPKTEKKRIFFDTKSKPQENLNLLKSQMILSPSSVSQQKLWFGNFLEGTKLFSFIDLEKVSLSLGKIPSVTNLELNINFRIPSKHKSVLLETGEILLIGGNNFEQGNLPSAKAFILSQKKLTLHEMASMNVARAGHGCCSHKGEVYVAGGITKGKPKFERFSLQRNTWTLLPDYSVEGEEFSLCSSASSIFKFGGKVDNFTYCEFIEVFKISENFWSKFRIVSENTVSRLPSNCGGFMTGEGLLIMGGYFYSNPSQDEFLISFFENPEKVAEVKEKRKSIQKGEILSEFVIFDGIAFSFSCEKSGKLGLDSSSTPKLFAKSLKDFD